MKDPIVQFKASKSSIKDFCSDILNETKGFKYHITVKALLRKVVYFNSFLQFISIQ